MTDEEKKAIEKLRNTSKQCHNSKDVVEYFENLAKESGEIDDK